VLVGSGLWSCRLTHGSRNSWLIKREIVTSIVVLSGRLGWSSDR
jgi:hypothetical protein